MKNKSEKFMPTPIRLAINEEQWAILESWARKGKTKKRLVNRAQIVLLSASGADREAIARCLGITPVQVSKWRKRFFEQGIDGLFDIHRSVKPRRYGEQTERQVLSDLSRERSDKVS